MHGARLRCHPRILTVHPYTQAYTQSLNSKPNRNAVLLWTLFQGVGPAMFYIPEHRSSRISCLPALRSQTSKPATRPHATSLTSFPNFAFYHPLRFAPCAHLLGFAAESLLFRLPATTPSATTYCAYIFSNSHLPCALNTHIFSDLSTI